MLKKGLLMKTFAKDIKCWACSTEDQLNWSQAIGTWLCDKCYAKVGRFIEKFKKPRTRFSSAESFINVHNLRKYDERATK